VAGAAREGRGDHSAGGRMIDWLVVFPCLPGVGKTSIAEIFAARTGLAHLFIDFIDAVELRRSNDLKIPDRPLLAV
jgi:Holliday junction resolvasome RuvABC ATP-dependent DNA helicase subunit